ncbi:hypothetical protein CHARACLAT_002671 [Characodon lateralis]|uniref:Uncharacterized protein n=1 Tax=Characodon lateralis TaxID=208331 RepID=A0ABU7EQK0_9TELE|nr:hypothetical protein [Characodon lateralis]
MRLLHNSAQWEGYGCFYSHSSFLFIPPPQPSSFYPPLLSCQGILQQFDVNLDKSSSEKPKQVKTLRKSLSSLKKSQNSDKKLESGSVESDFVLKNETDYGKCFLQTLFPPST